MDWLNGIQHIVQRYSGQGAGTSAAPAEPHQDFSEVSQSAPTEVVAGGLSQAFRSDQTPPFPQMLANLFRNSDPTQRAGLLNQILGSLGGGASLPGLGGLFTGGSITPQQASQVSPEQVQDIAARAERQNLSVVDQVSGFYAKHPDVVKAVGGLALTIALQHMLKRR